MRPVYKIGDRVYRALKWGDTGAVQYISAVILTISEENSHTPRYYTDSPFVPVLQHNMAAWAATVAEADTLLKRQQAMALDRAAINNPANVISRQITAVLTEQAKFEKMVQGEPDGTLHTARDVEKDTPPVETLYRNKQE